MAWLGQTIAVTGQSIRSLPQRSGSSLVAVIGVAGVVLVFVAVLSMAYGFQRTLATGGDAQNVIVLRSASTSELDSTLSGDQVRIVKDTPGLAVGADGPRASGEVYVMVDLPKKSSGLGANVPLRGVEPAARELRSGIEVIEGRWFEPGKNELVAGRGAQGQFSGLEVGQTIKFGQEQWAVVGVLDAGGGLAESELWADVRIVQGAYRRGNNFNSVHARLADTGALVAFKDALSADPRVSLKIVREPEYYAEQSRALSVFIKVVGYGIALLMALGAMFGALNTMYTAVAERSREIATLRALDFSPLPIVASVLIEALLLATAGGVIGGLAAWLLFQGFTVSTLNWQSFSQVVFAFAVTPELLTQGIALALVIGFFGGLLPAVRAARLPVSMALRAA